MCAAAFDLIGKVMDYWSLLAKQATLKSLSEKNKTFIQLSCIVLIQYEPTARQRSTLLSATVPPAFQSRADEEREATEFEKITVGADVL